jgi:hypothetical protein
MATITASLNTPNCMRKLSVGSPRKSIAVNTRNNLYIFIATSITRHAVDYDNGTTPETSVKHATKRCEADRKNGIKRGKSAL